MITLKITMKDGSEEMWYPDRYEAHTGMIWMFWDNGKATGINVDNISEVNATRGR